MPRKRNAKKYRPPKPYEPSPAEIAAACAKIRAGWIDGRQRDRAQVSPSLVRGPVRILHDPLDGPGLVVYGEDEDNGEDE